MDEKTLEALKGSIAKWEQIVAGTGSDNGPNNCPLCHLFWKCSAPGQLDADSCVGCPVMERTGKQGCQDTPHQAYERYWHCADDSDDDSVDEGLTERDLAQAELDFLRSLLPTP